MSSQFKIPEVTTSQDFSFPFPPYDIQREFMKALYRALEEKKLGIFESPTGTGKSLSLICGSLTWLTDHYQRQKDELTNIIEESIEECNSLDWFASTTKRIAKEEEKRKAKKRIDYLKKEENKIKNLYLKKICQKSRETKQDEFSEFHDDLKEMRKQVQLEFSAKNCNDDVTFGENEFILEDYKSDEESTGNNKNSEDEEDNDYEGSLKIYYCSRTHSQLSQFVREIQKTEWKRETRVVTLASRQNLCVNDTVTKLANLSLINERCLDMQEGKKGTATKIDECVVTKKKKTTVGCPFSKQTSIQNLSDKILVDVQDLEQLVLSGKEMKSCPYYASRNSIKDAQLVVLPYNSLLHKSTRKACNIKLKDNVVIVDEAHNLLETIANIHSAMFSYSQACGAHSQLTQYLTRYQKRLSPKNLLYINQIIFFIREFIKLLSTGESTKNKEPYHQQGVSNERSNFTASRLLTIQELLFETLTDNLNIFQLVQYIEKSKIIHKLHGFSKILVGQIEMKENNSISQKCTLTTSSFLTKMCTDKVNTYSSEVNSREENLERLTDKEENEENLCGSPLTVITDFMRALTCGSSDARVVVNIDKSSRKSFVKYLLLNPASQFHELVKECRSVIVAGGTMSPMEEFRNQLFLSAGANPERVIEFSCGHVVAKNNILPLVLKSGPGNVKLDFTFKNRNDINLKDELGRILLNVSNVVPGGIVCFFPSYEYGENVFQYLNKTGLLEKVSRKKRVFQEPKKSNQLDKVLREYSQTVRETNSQSKAGGPQKITGAIIFSVVGGKMSEGLNFSDDLGRCVIMVGLPYPNSTSPELREKMDYLNKNYPPNAEGKTAGVSFYENLCFKAVNQSIGRSIRHREDFSSILLLDHRYAETSSIQLLPSWISSNIIVCGKFGPAFGHLRRFFAEKLVNH